MSLFLVPGLADDLRCLLCDCERVSGALEQLHGLYIHLAERLHTTHVLKDVHADGEARRRQPLLLGASVNDRGKGLGAACLPSSDKVERGANRQVVNIDEVTFCIGYHDIVTLHRHFRQSGVLQSKHGSQEKRVNQVAIIIEQLQIYSETPSQLSLNDAKAFPISGS